MSFSTARNSVSWATAPRPRRRTRGLPALFLTLPLLVGLLGAPASVQPVHGDELSDARSKQSQLKKQISSQKADVARLASLQAGLSAEIRETTRELNTINADLSAVRKSVNRLRDRITIVEAAYAVLVEQLAYLDAQLGRIRAEEAEKKDQLRARRDLLAERIRIAYDTDRTSLLESFVSGGTFTDLLAEMSYLIDVGEQDKALAEQIAADRETLAAIHQTVVDATRETEDLRKETAAQKRELDASLAELKVARAELKKLEGETERILASQRSTYAKMARNKAAAQKAIREAESAQKALSRKISNLVAKQASQRSIPSEYNGTLRWPMSGTVSQNFGCTGFSWEPPLGNCAHFHKGIDIAGPMYTPIRAAGPGTVVFAGPNPYDPYPKAWIVVIAHSQNLVTWYAHVDNSSKPPQVRAGDTVSAGEIIAYNGVTGRTTGPHLHWMVELNGTFVNPRLFL